MKFKLIFWDWNGTLLDDAHIAMLANNRVFPEFGLPPILDLQEYLDVFTFPIKDYYTKIGVSDETFDEVATAWFEAYEEISIEASLQEEAVDILQHFSSMDIKQIIISASEKKYLNQQILKYNISHYFDDILGLDNIYAESKVKLAKNYISLNNILSDEVLFVGDTLHDAEVANAIKCRCILIAKGHNSKDRLFNSGLPVLNSLSELKDYIY